MERDGLIEAGQRHRNRPAGTLQAAHDISLHSLLSAIRDNVEPHSIIPEPDICGHETHREKRTEGREGRAVMKLR
jgi:hypothetical protein